MVKSTNYNQHDIIKDIIKLHLGGEDIECDPTYSKGNFYKDIPAPKYKFDLNPIDGVVKACSTDLPLEDGLLNNLMFDPPFLATTGKSLLVDDDSNGINKRFTVFDSEPKLHQYYEASLKEFHRVLKPNGVLIFKCQDKVSSGKQYFSHVWVCQKAIELGYYPLDLFILLAKNRIVADWQLKNQQHARKFHSYFWVFRKCDRVIKYS